jgi:hypothetical protein
MGKLKMLTLLMKLENGDVSCMYPGRLDMDGTWQTI